MKISDLQGYKVLKSGTGVTSQIQQPDTNKQQNDLLDNPITRGVQNFFPGEQVGQSIGTLAGLGIEKAKGVVGGKDNSQFYDVSSPTPLQTAGDIASGALNVAGFKGVGTVGTFAQRLLKTAGLGAGIGASESTAKGKNVSDTVKNATVGAVTGAALPVVGAGLNAVGKQIDTLPDRFLNSALGRSKSQIMKDITSGKTDTLNQYILDNKPIGTASNMLKDSTEAVSRLGNEVQTKLATAVRNSGSKVTIGRNNFLDEIVNMPEAQGALMTRKDVVDTITRIAPQTKQLLQKPSLTLEEANKLRQLLDSTLGDKAFLGGQLTNDKTIIKAFADNLRETVKSKAPQEVRGLFQELSNEIQLRNSLVDRIAQKSKNQVLSIGDIFGGGLGGVLGGGIPGAAAGIAIRRGIESVPFKIGAAKFTESLTKAAPILESMTPAQQTVILDLFSSLFGNADTSQEQDQAQ